MIKTSLDSLQLKTDTKLLPLSQQVNYPKISENKEINNGYNGQDQFAIVENTLSRRFPIFNSDGSPTGKNRQIEYDLVEGEASRQLIVNNFSEY